MFEVQPTEVKISVFNDTVSVKVGQESSAKSYCFLLLVFFSLPLKFKVFLCLGRFS